MGHFAKRFVVSAQFLAKTQKMESNGKENSHKLVEAPSEAQVVVNVTSDDGKPVKVVVVHRHVHSMAGPKPSQKPKTTTTTTTTKPEQESKPDEKQPEARAPPADASDIDIASASSRPILVIGSVVRLQVSREKLNRDGGTGCYLGSEANGAVCADFAGNSVNSVFKVEKRGQSDDIALRSALTGKNLRVDAKGAVNALGGNGKWTTFSALPHLGSSVALKSVANLGKVNVSGEQDWFLGTDENSSIVGNAPPTGFVVELVQEETKQEVDGKALQKEAKAPMSKEKKAEQQAKKDAQMAKKLLREEQKKEALLSGWTEVGTSPKGSNNKAVAKAKAKSMPTEAVPQLVLADDESSKKAAFRQVLKEFPTEQCDIRIAPVNFLKVDNRKGSQSWNVGVSPQGFLVPDASSGSWGTWVLTPVPNKSADGAFFIISSHTNDFRLAVSKTGMVTPKGGSGPYAQWVFQPQGDKFWSLRSRGSQKLLGVSSAGVLYSSDEPSKDTRFKIFSSFSK